MNYGYKNSSGIGEVVATIFVGLLLSLVIMALFGLVAAVSLYFPWNWLLPSIFGLSTITYWQAWGLVWLTSILFKSPGSSKSND